MRPIVRFQRVIKTFGDHRVLDGLDLDIGASEHVAIIGPSGSGKSTLLRVLMTLEGIDGGRVEVAGETLCNGDGEALPAAQIARLRAMIGMVFQGFHLFPHRRVLDNVALAPQIVAGLSRDEARERARALLASVDLSGKEDAYPRQLSGGQQQRVAIARALAMRPRIMLFDEVTSALDPELVGEVLAVLRRLAHESDVTMLLVTHQMDFARELADRIVFIDAGKVIEQGPPERILREPREQRTRTFLSAVLRP